MTTELVLQRGQKSLHSLSSIYFMFALLSTYYVLINVWMGKSIPILLCLVNRNRNSGNKCGPKTPHMKMAENVLPCIRSKLRNHILAIN